MATNGKKPVFERTYFPVRVAVFEHEGEGGRLNYTAKVTKTFRRGEDQPWENSEYLGLDELLPAAKLMEGAHAFIQTRLQQRYERTREERQNAGSADF